MTEDNKLKTLEEMGYMKANNIEFLNEKIHRESELKAEAIKWIKKIEKNNGVGTEFAKEWIMYFFNITNEELKDDRR